MTPPTRWSLISGMALMTGAVVVLYFYPPETTPFYPRCFLYVATGLQCPGCGGLRALHQLLHGHWIAAYQYNPLLVLSLPIGLIVGGLALAGQATGRNFLKPIAKPIYLWLILAAILAYGIGRNL